jgi:uncharacterized protein YegP (UPF0339 family)
MKRSFALMALMAGLAGSMTFATAQDTKKKADDKKPAAKAEDKKADDKKADHKGGVEIYQDKSEMWRFRVVHDGKTIAMPPKGYEKKEDVLKQLELVKKILAESKPEETKGEK